MAEKILFNVNDINKPVVIPSASLPSDFPFFTITGESPYEGDFFLTPHTAKTHTSNYIFGINNKGEVINYKKINNQAYDFKKVKNSKGETRYTYLDVVSNEEPTIGNVGFYENTELVVLDAKMNEIDRKRFKKAGSIPEDYPAENHFSLYIDDGHYIIANYFQLEGSDKYENAIQELKWGKVVWHWQTNDYPELATLSHTTPTGDYAHINAMNFDYDGNFIISFRNIGIVKINKETKEIMWVIGENRNDFADLDSSLIPYQQHDIRVVKNDGSITLFDNYGDPEQKSRVLRYWLDETTMTCEKAVEYVTTKTRSNYMGSALLVDGQKDVYDISYGSGWDFGFEEYDFSTNTQLMQLVFNDGYDLYNVTRYIDDLASSFSGGNTPVEPPIVLPTPTYSVANEVFDGTRYVDTGLTLFDEEKDFSFILKFNNTKTDFKPADYYVALHCMYEESPWNGITINTVINSSATGGSRSVDLNLSSSNRFALLATNSPQAIAESSQIIVFTKSATGEVLMSCYDETGTIQNTESYYLTIPTGEIRSQKLYLGAANMINEFDRFLTGNVFNFNYYDKVLSNEEIETVVDSLL